MLVIADDRKTADSIRVYLGKDDCIVIIAHDGGAVLKAALSGLPESVVLDLLLPELGARPRNTVGECLGV